MATKFLIFASKAEADAKELEIRNATKCSNVATKTSKYSEVIVKKDGTAILAIESTYNPETKQMVDVENSVLTSSEKTALVDKTNTAVKAELEKDTISGGK